MTSGGTPKTGSGVCVLRTEHPEPLATAIAGERFFVDGHVCERRGRLGQGVIRLPPPPLEVRHPPGSSVSHPSEPSAQRGDDCEAVSVCQFARVEESSLVVLLDAV